MNSPEKNGLSVVARKLTVASLPSRSNSKPILLLKDVSFQVEPGEFICILGPSGAGKSTLIKTILGDTSIISGSLLVGGHDAAGNADTLRGAIGYVPQNDINPPSLVVDEALYFASKVRLSSQTTDIERRAAVNQAVTDVDLNRVRQQPISQLSGGEMKRASIAAELIGSPGLLIADEATANLDPANEARIMKLLAARAQAGTTVIAVTHHLDNIDRADRILILGHGEVVWIGTEADALSHFQAQRLSEIYILIEDKPPGYWGEKWREREAVDLKLEEKSSPRVQSQSLAPISPPGISSQFINFLSREIRITLGDRFRIVFGLLLPVALALVVLLGFSATRYNDPVMTTRLLDSGEKEILADVWGEVAEAINSGLSIDEKSNTAAQITVFLESQPKLLSHLREKSTDRLIRDALTDTIPVAPDHEVINPAGTLTFITLLSTCMVILGFVTGFREIVSERTMLDLERRHGLNFYSYILAKVGSIALTLAVQVIIFHIVIELGLMIRAGIDGEMPSALYRRGFQLELVVNWMASLACASIALIVSACVRTTANGVLTVPLLITPQILLGGTILPIRGGFLAVIAKLISPLYWAHRGCRSEGEGVPPSWKSLGEYNPSIWIPLGSLFLQILLASLITVMILHWQEAKQIDRRRST